MTDHVWNTLPNTPRHPFGSALSPEKRQEIITPELITIKPKLITRPELRKMMKDEQQ